MGVPRFVVSLVLGLLGAGAMAKFLVPRGTAAAPLAATLLPLILCLTGGLPLASIGSWRSPAAVLHRISGVGCLVAPLFLVVREAITAQHAPAPLYYLTVAAIAANLVFGVALIPSRFPAYDVPAARGLAVGSLYGLAFLGWSLTFRVGGSSWFGLIRRARMFVYVGVKRWRGWGWPLEGVCLLDCLFAGLPLCVLPCTDHQPLVPPV